MKKIFLITILFLGSYLAFSQNRYILKVVSADLTKEQKRILDYKNDHSDSLAIHAELDKLVFKFRSLSYILTSVDSIYSSGDTLVANLYVGEAWQWSRLRKGNVPELILTKSGYRERFYRNSPFKYSELVELQKEILDYSQNHGYPFGTIQLDSISVINAEALDASLKYTSGPLITFDSIEIIGKTKVKKKFLMRYLRIFPGQPFSQEKIDAINKSLKELPYLKQTRPYAIVFNQEKAIINLYIEDKRSNQIDGIVGFMPNESKAKKLLVTGELNLNLKNLFGSGKALGIEWRKFNQASQLLNFSYYHPKILSANLDVKLDFNLLKQDSSFLNIARQITLSQKTNRYGRVNFSGGLRTSRELIGNKITDKTSLPPFTSYDYVTYGLGYDWNNLDDIFYPRKGWSFSSSGFIGNKSIIKSTAYPDSLYNNIQLKSVQINMNLKLEKYFRVGKQSVLVSRLEGGHIVNNQKNIFFNDMYRIGGLKSLRGFNENNFYASSYGIGTVEYRFFTDETSYLLLFFDQAYIRNPLNEAIPSDYPSGFGAGISFTTSVGIFNFIYSLGNSKTQNLSFNLSKIHFGMISRF